MRMGEEMPKKRRTRPGGKQGGKQLSRFVYSLDLPKSPGWAKLTRIVRGRLSREALMAS